MRHCAGSVAVVTVGREIGRRTGLTVTSVCSLSDDPPSLLVCVNRKASAHDRIGEEQCFGVNFLGARHAAVALAFSGQKGLNGDERYQFGTWRRDVTGAPILDDAVVSFDCRLREAIGVSTHSIFIGDILQARFVAKERPLVYLDGAFQEVHPRRDGAPIDDLASRDAVWNSFP